MADGAHREVTAAEEIAHSVTHGLGFGFALVALVLLVATAAQGDDPLVVTAAGIYGSTLVLLYAASTLFHALPEGPAKDVFEILDHSAIFLLIAGTHTPVTLVSLPSGWGWTLFSVVWTLAVVGIVQEAVTGGKGRRFQVALYLAMGWVIVVAIRPLLQSMEPGGLWLLAAGGAAYSLGVIFFAWRSLRWNHAIWHVFVLAGSVCHVFAILWFVLPATRTAFA